MEQPFLITIFILLLQKNPLRNRYFTISEDFSNDILNYLLIYSTYQFYISKIQKSKEFRKYKSKTLLYHEVFDL